MVSAGDFMKRLANKLGCLNPYYTGRWFLLEFMNATAKKLGLS